MTSRVTDAFEPARWLPHAHLQTIVGRAVRDRFERRAPPLTFRRERVELRDRDSIDLDWPELRARRELFAPIIDVPAALAARLRT